MTDCVRALTSWAFYHKNLNRVTIHCASPNQKSRSIPERLGYVQEGVFRDGECLYGTYYDLVIYGVLRRDWFDTRVQGNLYQNTAHLYDLDQRDNLTSDIPFYLDYAARTKGSVLELACGTGRVSLPLAEAGYFVTCIDLSEEMLNVFRSKLSAASEDIRNRIALTRADMSDFTLNDRFSLIIIPFRAFQSLTEESGIRSCLGHVREHLTENGLFIINVFRPYGVLDESWCYPDTIQWERDDLKTGSHVVKKHRGEKIDPVRQLIFPGFTYEITGPNGDRNLLHEKLCLKYYTYQQLKELLTESGFSISEEFGWYDKSGIENGRELIFVCKKSNP
jgi:SAM-dependent methyltransferase